MKTINATEEENGQRITVRVVWNEVRQGNAHVSDGTMGFWTEFPAGTTAQAVLDEFMSTADYSAATGEFTVCAEIDGNMAEVRVGPGGEVLS